MEAAAAAASASLRPPRSCKPPYHVATSLQVSSTARFIRQCRRDGRGRRRLQCELHTRGAGGSRPFWSFGILVARCRQVRVVVVVVVVVPVAFGPCRRFVACASVARDCADDVSRGVVRCRRGR